MPMKHLNSDDREPLPADQADDILHTEEELKAKVILPWLSDIGFDASELKLERVQSIKIGRQRVSVRYDFLVSRFDRPLMFIEAKSPGHVLSEDDRKQARVYALLNEPMAPTFMLTNGAETELYDAITNVRIDDSNVGADHPYFQDGHKLDPGADIRLRTNAIAQYVALSPENLRRFSSAQRRHRASHLVSSGDDELDRRVLPSLYVASEEMDRRWSSFLASGDSAFVVLGEPGIGKTNSLWAYSEDPSEGKLALFLDAGRLTDGLWAALGDDFGWAFSADMSKKEVLVRYLRDVAAEANCEILVFVDAIDEESGEGFPTELDDFCRRLAEHGIRVALTCRRWDWHRFDRIKDAPTWLSDQARVETLPPFTLKELGEAWAGYAAAFHLDAQPLSAGVAEKCRDRFTLRVVCEVYSGGQIPHRIDVPDLLSEFVVRKLAKSEDPATMDACLVALARWMVDHGASTIGSDELLALPSVTPVARDSLLGCELIASTENRHYRFANGQIQNLFVALRARAWGEIPVGEFGEEAERAFSSAVGQQALSWFWQHFPRHREEITQTIKGRALSFINQRNELIERWMPGFRPALEPHTERAAAICLHVDEQEQIYGNWKLRSQAPDGSPVVLEQTDEFMQIPHGTIYMSGGIGPKDAAGRLASEVETRLGGDVLHPSDLRKLAPFLPQMIIDEMIFAEAAPFAEQLQLADVNRALGNIHRGTFTRENLTEGIKLWSAYWFAQDEIVRGKLDRGEITVTTRDGISTYNSSLTEVDRAKVERLVAASIAGQSPIPLPKVDGDVPPAAHLLQLLDLTKSQEFSSTIPEPDIPLKNGGNIESFFSPELQASFGQGFFEQALPALCHLAQSWFLPVLNEARPWLVLPLGLVWSLRLEPGTVFGGVVLTYALGESPTGEPLVAEASEPINLRSEEPFRLAGKEFTAHSRVETEFSSLLTHDFHQTGRRDMAPTPTFDWVLGQLRSELPKELLLSLFEER